jgi:AcrR family transcriptional regulator
MCGDFRSWRPLVQCHRRGDDTSDRSIIGIEGKDGQVADANNIADALVAVALRLAATEGWRGLSLVDIAGEAGVSLVDAYTAVPSKSALLAAVLAGVDRRVLAGGPADGDCPRDRLFDVLMRRFDALQESRQAYIAILDDVVFDPLALAPVLPDFARSMAWMLGAAAVPTDGLLGNLRVKVLSALYLSVLRTWRDDDSLDLARTMAALDRGLGRIDEVVGRCPRLAGTPPRRAGASSPPRADASDSEGLNVERPSDA